MSAPTVSMTANPTAASHRRAVVAGDKKSNLGFAAADVGDPDGAGDGNDKRNPRIHSIRSGDVVEKVKKTVSVGYTNSAVSPKRYRKHLKPEQPRWRRIVSVFANNFVFLVVVALFIQMIVRLRAKGTAYDGVEGLGELEGRIANIEKFTKKTANMIQMQVDIVDRKFKDRMIELREELGEKIEGRVGLLEGEVRRVEERSEELERLIREVKPGELLSKRDLERVVEELRKGGEGAGVGGGGELSLDDVKVFARELVEKEIEKHAADGLGRADYALASGGAMVVKHSEPYVVGKVGGWLLNGGRNGAHREADKMLRPSFGEPGECFPLKGSSGFIQIKLRTAIIPEAITLEHVAKSVAYDRSSAPKDCRVSGWLQGHELDKTPDAEKMFLLREFTYDLEKSNAQTFDVLDSAVPGIINTIRLDFTSNHGSPSHTCIYRVRVHGNEPESVPVMAF